MAMTGMSKFTLRFAAPFVLLSMISGCALTARRASIAELKYNPGRYHDRTVSIDGVVTSAYGGPFIPVQMYKVDDGTGELFVISQHGRVPTKGAHVRVKGRVGDVATLGGRAVGLHLRETDLDFKRQ
jgi:hypothetical protein